LSTRPSSKKRIKLRKSGLDGWGNNQ
jgi:hypothetical protein